MPPPPPQPAPGKSIRVLIADDSAFMRRALTRLLAAEPGIVVLDTARNGLEAVEKAKALKPDVMTLDVEMPELDGISALRRIRAECPSPPAVLMCSSLTSAGSHEALKALRLGAADVIGKEGSAAVPDIEKMRAELIAKVRAIAPGAHRAAALASHAHPPASPTAPSPTPPRLGKDHRFRTGDFALVVVGSSTGGPPVLETLTSRLPADLPVPVLVAQHMPAMFTKSLAERLDELSPVTVIQAESGMRLLPGTVYIAPGGRHVRVVASGMGRMAVEVSDEPREALYKPSVNELFASAARAVGAKALGVMCTGMGDDGCLGSKELKAKGGTLLAQEASTCVVYGMPRAVVQAGLADGVMAPADLAAAVASLAPSEQGGGTKFRGAA